MAGDSVRPDRALFLDAICNQSFLLLRSNQESCLQTLYETCNLCDAEEVFVRSRDDASDAYAVFPSAKLRPRIPDFLKRDSAMHRLDG